MKSFKAVSINNYGDTRYDIAGGDHTLASVLGDPALNQMIPGLDGTPVLITEFGAEAASPAQYQMQSETVEQGLSAKFGNWVTDRYV